MARLLTLSLALALSLSLALSLALALSLTLTLSLSLALSLDRGSRAVARGPRVLTSAQEDESGCAAQRTDPSSFIQVDVWRARKKRDMGWNGRAKCQSAWKQPPPIGAPPEGRVA
ncbi:MAG TPA: hypothetical protein VLS88_17420 [Polyangiales bacterium]|nr:hypothetical protein [Polyangiales bacterium]